jgi:hypothetical protein
MLSVSHQRKVGDEFFPLLLVYSIDMTVCIVAIGFLVVTTELCWYRRYIGLYAVEFSSFYAIKPVSNNYS